LFLNRVIVVLAETTPGSARTFVSSSSTNAARFASASAGYPRRGQKDLRGQDVSGVKPPLCRES